MLKVCRRLATTASGSGTKGVASGASQKSTQSSSSSSKIATTPTTSSATSSSNILPSVETYRPKDLITPAFVTSDVPEYMMTKRQARIFRPTKNAMQSGTNETSRWQIDFDAEQKWTNPLMGWASRCDINCFYGIIIEIDNIFVINSSDAVQALRLRFDTKEDAIQFAEKQGMYNFVSGENAYSCCLC